ncbi:MAG: helix-turn-helix domain-containing protein [Acidimicrobiales bacterium]
MTAPPAGGGLDLDASKLFLVAEIRRIHCRRCGRVRTEDVPWARPAARHTQDFEDVVAWLCRHTDKTTVTKLLRTSWETVAGIVGRVVAEHVDTGRLEGLTGSADAPPPPRNQVRWIKHTRNSKRSTARSASSTTAATATTPPPPSSP